ncbi:UNVERIFIED_CONTAM: hypothetical protein Slati_3436000 [Sesamum latifolium]|uniref:Uncharacterized protein n=1 Tax=Sesamum latifolium TaxID=2727402 RepID=A0AAW2UJB3_9LAMI
MSKRSGTGPSAYTGGWRWILHQATVVSRHSLDESSEEEEMGEDKEEADSSLGAGVPLVKG